MREYFTYGSVRGAVGNGGPYRVRNSLRRMVIVRSLLLCNRLLQCCTIAWYTIVISFHRLIGKFYFVKITVKIIAISHVAVFRQAKFHKQQQIIRIPVFHFCPVRKTR